MPGRNTGLQCCDFSTDAHAVSISLDADLIKAFSDVAPIALTSEAAPVNVVFPVAAAAGSRKRDLPGYWYPVTTFACQSFVRPVQDVVGLCVVVECP